MLVLVTALVSSGATMLVTSALRFEQGNTVTISQDEYALLQKYYKLDNLITVIKSKYVEEVDDETLIENAAYGMVALLGDPYSYYLSPESMEAMAQEDSGKYVGIGAVFTTDPNDGMMVCTRIYPNSPAAESGMQVGDRLYKVNGESILGMALTDVTGMVRGEEGTTLSMTFVRDNDEVEVTLTRREVEVVELEYRMLDGDILYISLSSFSTNADEAFDKAISFGKKKNMKGILLDLRGNGGGADIILEPIADHFLPEGVIFYMEDADGVRTESVSDAYHLGLPTVVLCDENRASASEVVIAAIQDYGVGTIVGTKTFGKAIGQGTFQISADGSGVNVTTVRAYSPNGRHWHGEGLEPDIVIEQPEELKDNPLLRTDENDVQFIEAVKILKEMIEQE